MYNERILPWFKENVADALLLKKQTNVRWVSGFKGADSCVLVTVRGGFLITDPRYTEQAEIEAPDFALVNWRVTGGSVIKAIASIVKENNIKTLAFEGDVISFDDYSELKEIVDIDLVSTQGVVEELRSIKTTQEIEYIRNACEISCRAFWRILDDIKVGVTEKELAAKLSAYMVMEGADTQPYGNILISGPNTSLLHGIPSDRAVHYGDFVLMDYGCQFNGYMSDMTRTVVVGKASNQQKEVYGLVKKMIEDSIDIMKVGTVTGDVYEKSIQAIKDGSYYEYHYNGIGHGIGMFVHEVPFIRPGATTVYKENMVTTIEPGLYIPGWGGCRIEDQLIIREDGNENLISVPHDLIEL